MEFEIRGCRPLNVFSGQYQAALRMSVRSFKRGGCCEGVCFAKDITTAPPYIKRYQRSADFICFT